MTKILFRSLPSFLAHHMPYSRPPLDEGASARPFTDNHTARGICHRSMSALLQPTTRDSSKAERPLSEQPGDFTSFSQGAHSTSSENEQDAQRHVLFAPKKPSDLIPGPKNRIRIMYIFKNGQILPLSKEKWRNNSSERDFFSKHYGLIHLTGLRVLKRLSKKKSPLSLVIFSFIFPFHRLSSFSSCLFFSLSSSLSSSYCLFSCLASSLFLSSLFSSLHFLSSCLLSFSLDLLFSCL